jgi:hypothetical protein
MEIPVDAAERFDVDCPLPEKTSPPTSTTGIDLMLASVCRRPSAEQASIGTTC